MRAAEVFNHILASACEFHKFSNRLRASLFILGLVDVFIN
jgi:hypothetical protein